MFSSMAARSLFRAARTASSLNRPTMSTVFMSRLTTAARMQVPRAGPNLAIASRKPVATALVRQASTSVSNAGHGEEGDVDVMAGARNDLKTIQDTFSLADTPKDALVLGFAGTLPYVGTALGTTFLSWEVNNQLTLGATKYISGETAQVIMNVIEPVQVGYGAVILSFLGAVHWGFEWAQLGGGRVGYRRYLPGVIAPAVAWPTLFMPFEWAIISQFLSFSFLYYTDAIAATKGYAPSWYGIYRFVLTLVVGAAMVTTLVGREHLVLHYDSMQPLQEKLEVLASKVLPEPEASEEKLESEKTEESE